MAFFKSLSGLFFPEIQKCVYCGRDVPDGQVCVGCAPGADRLRNNRGFYGNLLYVYAYEGPVRLLIHNFKYNDMPFLGAYMAEQMHHFLLQWQIEYDLITFVPVHAKRLRWRGFDQSEMLANYLSAQSGVPCLRLLCRVRNTKPQFELSREERKNNLKHAFTGVPGTGIAGKRVLLVDDICTTGSTLRECEIVLKGMRAAAIPFVYARED